MFLSRKLAFALLPALAVYAGCLSDSNAPSPDADTDGDTGTGTDPDPSENQPPMADAGPDRSVVDADGDGGEMVALDASGSHDADDAIVSFAWREGSTPLGDGPAPSVLLATGVHPITLTVTDERGAQGVDTIIVTVASIPDGPAPPANFRLAVTGDTDHGSNARRVFQLVRDEGADALLVAGDLSYAAPSLWTDLVDEVFGPDFPVFAVVGNHDTGDWSEYRAYLEARADHVGATWSGEYGVESTLEYENLFFVLLGAGTRGSTSSQESYLSQQLASHDHVWEIACWHKNMRAMQVGRKGDETGWGVYENARAGGALIFTGHEHSYERTHVLSDMTNRVIADDASPYVIRPGQTMVTVSGLGGASIRKQERCLPATYPYGCPEWGSVYTADQGARYGALILDFHVDGDPRKARATFRNIDGGVVDAYDLRKRD